MPKFLIQATYTAEGLIGLAKDTAAGRKAAVQAAVKAVKGKIDSMYFSFGADEVFLVVDAPDNIVIASLSLNAGASGLVNIRVTPLLTVEEVDQALALPNNYRPPGA